MFKKKAENKEYSENESLLVKFLSLQTDEYIVKFIKARYKAGQFVDQSTACSAGGLRILILDDNVEISRNVSFNYTKIYIGTIKVWCNENNGKYIGKAKLAKIVE